MEYHRRRRAESSARVIFTLSALIAVFGLLTSVVGLGVGFAAGTFIVLWVGLGLLGFSVLAMFTAMVSGVGIARMDVEEALETRSPVKKPHAGPQLPVPAEHSEVQPDDPETLFSLGVERRNLERYDEALAYFDNALERIRPSRKTLQERMRDFGDNYVISHLDPRVGSLLAAVLHNRGVSLWHLGREWEAVFDFNLARMLRPEGPEDPEILLMHGLVLRDLEHHPRLAIAEFNRAVELQPDNPVTLYQRALTRVDLGHNRKALEDFNRVLRADPDNLDASIGRGRALLNLELYDEALKDFDRVLELNPAHADALYYSGVTLVKLSNYYGALDHFDRVLALAQYHPEDQFFWWRGFALIGLHRYTEALADAETYLHLSPDDPDALDMVNTLRKNAQQKRPSAVDVWPAHPEYRRKWDMPFWFLGPEDPLPDFDRALELRPDDPDILANRGDALLWLGSCGEALSDFSRALELLPADADILAFRGMALKDLNRYSEALIDYNRALELRPDDPKILADREEILRIMKPYQETLAECDAALQLQPSDPELRLKRGNALRGLERYSEALKEFSRALDLRPDDTNILAHRAHGLETLERYEEALADYNLALQLRPDSDLLFDRGRLLLGLRRLDEALADYDRALELGLGSLRSPSFEDLLFQFAISCAVNLRYQEALECLTRAVAKYPGAYRDLADMYLVDQESAFDLLRDDLRFGPEFRRLVTPEVDP